MNVNGTFLCLSIYVYLTIYGNVKVTRLFSIQFQRLFLNITSGFEYI